MMTSNWCVCCGEEIPDGRQVCIICEKYEDDAEMIEMQKLERKLRKELTARKYNKLSALINRQVTNSIFGEKPKVY